MKKIYEKYKSSFNYYMEIAESLGEPKAIISGTFVIVIFVVLPILLFLAIISTLLVLTPVTGAVLTLGAVAFWALYSIYQLGMKIKDNKTGNDYEY